jgi:integrase
MVDRCKSKVTAKDYYRHIRHFLTNVGKPIEQISIEDIREYMLRLKETRSIAHYTNLLSGLKSFFRDFLKRPEVIDGFKFPAKEIAIKTIPSRQDLARFYLTLPDIRIKAIFLMLASTGLRLGEILSLKLENVDFTRRMVVPKCHSGETKRSWVSFYNRETQEILEQFLKVRYKRSAKLFPIGEPDLKNSWDVARQATGLDLQRKDLRDWFADEMGRLGVQDRYIDAFQGRTPKSVLARHYSDYAPDKLQVIYEKAQLKILASEILVPAL